jgi:hypothetical protein
MVTSSRHKPVTATHGADNVTSIQRLRHTYPQEYVHSLADSYEATYVFHPGAPHTYYLPLLPYTPFP